VEILTYSENWKPQLSEADVAFELLQVHGSPRNYHDLIVEVLTRLELPADALHISAVLTQLNLDTRFVYTGRGKWGLKAWVAGRHSKKQPAVNLLHNLINEEEADKDFAEEGGRKRNVRQTALREAFSELDDSFQREADKYVDKWGQV
jgi:DNA-directed RNA polymerase subunit delta